MRLLLLSNAKREGMGYLEHARDYFQCLSRGSGPRGPVRSLRRRDQEPRPVRRPGAPGLRVAGTGRAWNPRRARPVRGGARRAGDRRRRGKHLEAAARASPRGTPAGHPQPRGRRDALRRLERGLQHRVPHDHDDQRHADLRPGRIRRARPDPVPDQSALPARQSAGLQGRDAGGAHQRVRRAASGRVGRRDCAREPDSWSRTAPSRSSATRNAGSSATAMRRASSARTTTSASC